MLIVVLAAVTALSGGFIAGVVAGLALAQARRDAGRIAPHEALRPLYPMATDTSEWGWP